MPRSYSRTERVGQLIQTAIAKMIQDCFRDQPGTFVTVTGVEVSPDYSLAKVFISVLPDDKAVLDGALRHLQLQRKHLRYELAHTIKLRAMPDIRFYFDESVRAGSHMSSLLNQYSAGEEE